jgi:hypothetical protein
VGGATPASNWAEEDELVSAQAHFRVVQERTKIPVGSLVIPRFSMLPYPEELGRDVANLGGSLINSCAAHKYVADLGAYYPDLEGLTPRTWGHWHGLPEGAYVVKGATNSRKHEWCRRMFAPTVKDIPRIANSLLDDAQFGEQGLFVREYIPLRKFGEGLNGLPITNEWRVFVLHGEILVGGYYWSSEPECCPTSDPTDLPSEAVDLVRQVISRVADRIPFFVVDVAEKESGGWTVIELNDGTMSGLSMIPASIFYRKLKSALCPV